MPFCCPSYLSLFNFPIKVAIEFNKDVRKKTALLEYKKQKELSWLGVEL